MDLFWLYTQALVDGLLAGVMYSLVALGFVLIFKASGVLNFAQGAMVFMAGLTFVSLMELGLHPVLAGLATAATAYGAYKLFKKYYRRCGNNSKGERTYEYKHRGKKGCYTMKQILKFEKSNQTHLV